MSKLDLRLRNLQTGDTVNAMFENEVDAMTWLRDRPRFTQVLGVATHGLPEAVYKLLRASLRPLDEEEAACAQRIEEAEAQAARALVEQEQRREEEEMAAHREALRHADPHRPMALRWLYESGLSQVDPADEREITPDARAAVLAWVQERDEWVKDRGLVVGEAQLEVWPGPIPKGRSERILPGGQFFPMAKPA